MNRILSVVRSAADNSIELSRAVVAVQCNGDSNA